MSTMELIKQFQMLDANQVKEEMEKLMIEGYRMITSLKRNLLHKSLTIDQVINIENYFNGNVVVMENVDPMDRYLSKYVKCIGDFWESYKYYRGNQISKGKYDFFISLKTEDILKSRSWLDDECATVMRRMEDFWMASNQIYTKYQVLQIKKTILH